MPKCQRCGKTLNDDEFYLCSNCEKEGLYQDFTKSEDDNNEFINDMDY